MKYEITKEQIRLIEHQSVNEDYGQVARDMREWFPEAFKTVLEVGKWYKSYIGTLSFYSGEERMYGISSCGQWNDAIITKTAFESCCLGVWTEADFLEVSEALEKEFIRRGFSKGVYYKSVSAFTNGDVVKLYKDVNYYSSRNMLTDGCNGAIFENGKWAEIIPTITKKEAEKQLGKKIID